MMVEYTHPNGYSARLYGNSSMIVMFEGKEVSHTGSRAVHTREQVMDMLEKQPALMKMLREHIHELMEAGGKHE